MNRCVVIMIAFLVAMSCGQIIAQDTKAGDQWKPLFDGKSLAGWKVTDFGGEGEVTVQDGQILMRMGQPLTGITWKDEKAIPTDNFEISLQAMKRKGDDFF